MSRFRSRSGRRLAALSAALAIPLIASGSVKAQNNNTSADVQCIVAGLQLASERPDMRADATLLAIYYIGRIDGRSPKLELEPLLKKEATSMTAADFQSTLRRCSAMLQAKGKEITRIGRDLQKAGK